ncbi:MAG: calcium/sodium antiporter [Clostridia bacterium]|nr:calcium/sodium antiporter [Clostridia bacterium]
MLIELILIGLGLALLMKGADFLVDGSSKIAKKFKIPEIVIGLTIVAIGTSLPELVISAESAFKGISDISIGNVVGSNIANLFLIISLCAVIEPILIKRETKYIENPIVILCTCILYLIISNDGAVLQNEGIALIGMSLLYVLYNVVMSRVGNKLEENGEELKKQEITYDKRSQTNKNDKKNNKLRGSLIYPIVQIIIGIIALKFGGDFVVDNAVLIAERLGISKKLISLTIVAFGTSLPELITCISATKKGESDLAVGNIIGSQILNILLIVGVSATIMPILDVWSYLDELKILIIGNIIFALLPFIGQKNKIGRASGLAFVSFYIVYMVNLVIENIANQF